MGISLSAMDTLAALDEGSVFNATHRFARELIAMGLALEHDGRLFITELGRLAVRQASTDRFSTPAHSHPDVLEPGRPDYRPDPPEDHTKDWPPIDRSPNTWWKNHTTADEHVANLGKPLPQAFAGEPPPEVLPPATGPLAWNRARAASAAGIANGKTNIWVEDTWVQAFMDAYEG